MNIPHFIPRSLGQIVAGDVGSGKCIIVIGARQVGKTTLLNHIAKQFDTSVLNLNCDEPEVREMLEKPSLPELRSLIGKNRMMIIDEAQRVNGIGLTMKRIVENFPDVTLMATGSSSLQLTSKLNEPLTGRKFEYKMYPVSTGELIDSEGGLIFAKQLLNFRLVYGSYPEIITHQDRAQDLLMQLSDSYLYKDLLSFEGVRRPALLPKLLTALALQVGSEVSYNELAQMCGTDAKTAEKYVDLLEKCFVVLRLPALSRNMRNEIKRGKKIYFVDCGIRNAVIQNFAKPEMRADMGALWENFFIIERMKFNAYRRYNANYYFWRTTDQQEIDFIEEKDGRFEVFEMKWNPIRGNSHVARGFISNYPVSAVHIITPDNYMVYLTQETESCSS